MKLININLVADATVNIKTATMHLILVIAGLMLAMPITGFGWAEGSNLILDPHSVCKKTRRLRGKLHEICKNDTGLMKEIARGIDMGFRECEYQFKNRRWNCTLIKPNMKKILTRDSRESSFVSAITAAGVTYAVTRACTMGNLVECSCDKNQILKRFHYNSNGNIDDGMNGGSATTAIISHGQFRHEQQQQKRRRRRRRRQRRKNMNNNSNNNKNNVEMDLENKNIYRNIVLPEGDWEWGGCGDNIHFGFRKSKDFLDSRYRRRSDIKTLIKLHNNNAGRLAVKSLMRLECKCHGLSGSCTIKTCWMKMAPFREIGYRLKERFDGAAKVIARNDGHSFMPEGLTIKPPTRHDLVYTDDSDDFCKSNPKTGSLGTVGRECNATSPGVDGCDLLCCNRGYERRLIREKVNCRCMFKWCCEVTCSTCIEKREINTCR